jgi:TonB family protein
MRVSVLAVTAVVMALSFVASVASAAVPAAAIPIVGPSAVGAVIADPEWERQPDAGAISRRYPERALERGVSGRALLECAVAGSGALQDCRVVSETPKEQGFGDAALAMAWDFKMKPRTVAGEPVEGAHVRIPIRFQTEAPSPEETVIEQLMSGDIPAHSRALERVALVFAGFLGVCLALAVLLFVWPMAILFRRAGASPALAILFCVPGFSVLVPWIAVMDADESGRANRLVS